MHSSSDVTERLRWVERILGNGRGPCRVLDRNQAVLLLQMMIICINWLQSIISLLLSLGSYCVRSGHLCYSYQQSKY
jgi:hypothetical protein